MGEMRATEVGDDRELSAQLRFYGLSDETRGILKKNKPYIMAVMPQALDAFYDHIAKFPEAVRFFRSPAHIQHAREMQLRHWDLITDGDFGEPYVASVTRVGEVHNRIGSNRNGISAAIISSSDSSSHASPSTSAGRFPATAPPRRSPRSSRRCSRQ